MFVEPTTHAARLVQGTVKVVYIAEGAQAYKIGALVPWAALVMVLSFGPYSLEASGNRQ